jgi:hypothetical protein
MADCARLRCASTRQGWWIADWFQLQLCRSWRINFNRETRGTHEKAAAAGGLAKPAAKKNRLSSVCICVYLLGK